MGIFGSADKKVTATFVGKDQLSGSVKHIREEMGKLGGPKFGPLGSIISGFAGLNIGAVGLGAGIGAATGFLVESAKAAIDEQKSIDQLNVSLADNVPARDRDNKAIEASIKAGEKLAFNAEDQRSALALLLTRTHDVGKATALLAQAEDLARLKGIDLATASGVLGKVFNGNFTAANKMGIAIAKGSTATQALAQIQKAAAGQAEAYGNSTQGALDKAAIAWHEAEVAIGTGIAPAIKVAAEAIVTLIDDVGGLGTAFDNLHRFVDPNYAKFEDLRNAALDQAKAFGVDGEALQAYIDAQKAQQDATTAGIAIAKAHVAEMVAGSHLTQQSATDSLNAANATQAQTAALLAQNQAKKDADAAAISLLAERAQEHRDDAVSTQWQRTLADAIAHTASVYSDSVDRQASAAVRTNPIIAGMAQHAYEALQAGNPIIDRGSKYLFKPIKVDAAQAAKDAENYLGQIPVLGSQQFRDGLSLVKQAMAEYQLAITQPVDKATELAAIQADLTSKKIRNGLKSKNPQIRQDTADLVAWLLAERAKLNGSFTITTSFNRFQAEAWQPYRKRHPNDANFPKPKRAPSNNNDSAPASAGGDGHSHDIYLDAEMVVKTLDKSNGRRLAAL